MDLLDTVMELFNGTPSPPINVLPSSASIMEPNNLSQTSVSSVNSTATGATTTTTTTTTVGETAPATTQTNVERNLELKLPILSSSSSDSELDEQTNPLAGTSNKAEGERAASPPPNCAICLCRCKNKCFTDSCKHQFCFKCLCEWSKVKPECPLCKQTFKSIIHNVKSKDQFEEYHVQPPTVQIARPPFEMDFQEMRIFGVVHPGHNRNHPWNESAHRPFFDFDFSSSSPYSLSTARASSSNRSIAGGLRNQYVYRGELLDLYRQEYPGAIASNGTLSQLWRRYVYDRILYAMPVADITGRFRESSARFYRDNPSQIHRLMPWINRDIVCLLRETQHDVTTVLESINSALTIMNILSPAFRRRLQPFLGTKTAHFIHELNNFARSPYDMIGYDRAVQYSPQSNNEEIIIEFTSSDDSSDNEHIDVAGDGSAAGSSHHNHHSVATTSSSSSSSRSRSSHNGASINAINLTIHNRLTSASGSGSARAADIPDDDILVIDLRGESDINDTTTSTAQATTNSSTYHENGGQNAANSEGDMMVSHHQPSVAENIELTSGSSDECEFVLERKPPHLRTPEMVSLDSASDSDVVFVEESKPLNKTSFSSSEGELNDNPSEHKQTSRHHNKISALVESKKRNQAANLVKSEQHTEVYNMGASTSAALRLSLQNRKDKSRRADSASSSNRLRRDKYALRNNEKSSRAERPKRRGKRLDSESSHSSTSSSTTISSSSTSTTSITNSSSCSSSDEDYVASTSQRRSRNDVSSSRKRRTVRKTKKRKASSNGNRKTRKRDSRKRKKYNDYSSDEEEDEDDNGHMGKNFALVMAINERQKRQNQKNSTKQTRDYHHDNNEGEEDEEDSDGENSWRLKAVNEPLRKQQQQQQQQRTKIGHKNNERKRRRKTSTTTQTASVQQTAEEKDKRKNDYKRQKYEDHTQPEIETLKVKTTNNYKSEEDTSSDESDNINLIQLKTKLTGQDQLKDIPTNPTHETTKDQNNPEETEMERENLTTNDNAEDLNTNTTTANAETQLIDILPNTTPTSISDYLSIPPTTATTPTTNTSTTENFNSHSPLTTLAIASQMATNNTDSSWTLTQNDLLNFTDDEGDSNDNNDHNNSIDNNEDVANNTNYLNDPSQQNEQQPQELTTNSTVLQTYHSHHPDDDDEETLMPSNIQLNRESSNVFVDGTSMTSTTTTTDTILHEAAEQISSAAVNFYNPQQSFNTADFADENSTNSSSSDSSMSSITTSMSSSSNSSSSNTQTSFTNYGRDRS